MKPRILVGATALAGAFAVTGMVAYACIPIATLNLSQTTASPGSQVTASIHAISGADNPPVVFHWATADGTVLATATPGEAETHATLTIPTSVTATGDYMIVATQTLKTGYQSWGMPARAVIHVEVPGSTGSAPAIGAATAPSTGPAGLTTASGMSTGLLVLIAVGTAAAGLLIVGGATLVAGRGGTAKAEKVSSKS